MHRCVLLQDYAIDPTAYRETFLRFGSPSALLRGAAKRLEQAGDDTDLERGYPKASGEQELQALRQFARTQSLMLHAASVRSLIRQYEVGRGLEPEVGALRKELRVVKVYDTSPGTFFPRPKAVDSLFDY